MSYKENYKLIDWSTPISPERKRYFPPERSGLPCPYVISDCMPETEHVDGNFYTSKRAFRRVTREQGCIEIGNEKLPPPKERKPDRKAIREALRRAKARI